MGKIILVLAVASVLIGCGSDNSDNKNEIEVSNLRVSFNPKLSIKPVKSNSVFNDKFDTNGYKLCYKDELMQNTKCIEVPTLVGGSPIELLVNGNAEFTLSPNDNHDAYGYAVKLDGVASFQSGGSENIVINASNTRYAGIVVSANEQFTINSEGTFVNVAGESRLLTNDNGVHHFVYVDTTIQKEFPLTVQLNTGEIVTTTVENASADISYQFTIKHDSSASGVTINSDIGNLGVVDGCIGSACGLPEPESSPITLTGLNLSNIDSIVTVSNSVSKTLALESKGMKGGSLVDLDMVIAGTLPECSDTARPPMYIGQLQKFIDGWHIAAINLPVSQNPDCRFVFEERKYLVKNDGTLAYDTKYTPLANLIVAEEANTELNNISDEVMMFDPTENKTYAVKFPEAGLESTNIILKPLMYGNFAQGGYGNITSYDGRYYIATVNTNGVDVYMLVDTETNKTKKVDPNLVGYGVWNIIDSNGDFLAMADTNGNRSLHIIDKTTGEFSISNTALNNHQIGFYPENAFVYRDGDLVITATGSILDSTGNVNPINITSGVIADAMLHDGYKYAGVVQIIKGDFLVTSNKIKDTFTKYNIKTGEIVSKTIDGVNHEVMGMNENIVVVKMTELGTGDIYIAEYNFNTGNLTDTRLLEGDNLDIIEIKPI